MTKNEIFKKSCQSCAPLGITISILNAVKEESATTVESLKETLQKHFTHASWENIPYSVCKEVKHTVLKTSSKDYDVLAGILGMCFITDVTSSAISSLLTQFLYLKAQEGKSVLYTGVYDHPREKDFTQLLFDTYTDDDCDKRLDLREEAENAFNIQIEMPASDANNVQRSITLDTNMHQQISKIVKEEYTPEKEPTTFTSLSGILSEITEEAGYNVLAECLIDAIAISSVVGLKEDTANALYIALREVDRAKGIRKHAKY